MSTGAAGGSFDPQQALSQHVLEELLCRRKVGEAGTLALISPVTEEVLPAGP